MINRLAPGHNFLLCLGSLTLSFSKITGISSELGVTMINEGGLNDRAVTLYSPRQGENRLIFEHGIGILNPMNMNFEAAKFGQYFNLPGTILTFSGDKIARVYGFSGAKPIKWSLSEMNAQDSSILIDMVEIIHDGIFEIPYAGGN